MKQLFPELRHTKTDSKGMQYMDGYPQDGIATFFYFKENVVIEECLAIQSKDGFPRLWFDKTAESFATNYPPSFGISGHDAKHWCYSDFSVHLLFMSEDGVNTAMIVYEAGGWKTGITGADFFQKYK